MKKPGRKVPAAPLGFEEMLRLQDEPDREQPEAIKEELLRPRIYLSGIPRRGGVADYLTSHEELKRTFSMRLPAGASIGLAGRTGVRLTRTRAKAALVTSMTPHRPNWSGLSYHPRVAEPFHQRRIRTIKGGTVEAFYGVYSPDERRVYYPQTYPWGCTGRIFTYTSWPTPNWSWSGSGVLIGPRHVLTAGHVAPWGSASWAMLFVPGYWDGASVFGAGACSYVSDYRGWNNAEGTAYDSCVLRLYEPLGNWLGYLGARTYDDDWEGDPKWVLTGYPGDIACAERPVYQAGVAVLDDDEDGDAMQIEHHGDSSPGESGGPMFGFWDDGPYAIGTTSGGERRYGNFLGIGDEDNNIAAGGDAMVDLLRWGRNNWP
jgi:V8-like Glu-specific endopeptidase